MTQTNVVFAFYRTILTQVFKHLIRKKRILETQERENMFNENEDWNDEQDAQILNKTVFKNTQKVDINTNVKVVGKKSLLQTLQTLGSVPEWKSNNHEQQDSDSETEAAPSQKKKRRKKRKRGAKSEEQKDDKDVGQTVEEKKPVSKKKKENKPGTAKSSITSTEKTKNKTNTESPQVSVNKPQGTERLSRRQWKNKMKNKRICKNKFRPKQPEEDVDKDDKQEPKEKIKSESRSSNNSCENTSHTENQKKNNLKRKNTDGETDIFTTAEKEKRQQKENKKMQGKVDNDPPEDSADGSKQKGDELQAEITNKQKQFSTKRQKLELNKEQNLKRQKLQKILLSQQTDQLKTPVEQKEAVALPEEEVKQSRSDSLRSRMEQRLEASRFRYINELLYTTSSGEARRMFQQDPQAFRIYHKGYTAQVQRWPANPVDTIISYIRKKPSSLVVADFGCGDCKIARSVKNKVHSFDLAATCELVTVCDMANVPLGDGSVDVAVFCLSLMGTNLADFLAEANRVLKTGGILKIAEVASRFDNMRNFITALARLGFKMTSKDTENSHFHSFEFVKTGNAPKNVTKIGLQLKPCVYKKR